MNLTFVLEMIGTVAFASSGAQLAAKKKMDIMGVAVLGLTTAVFGGIFRDLILGITPPAAFCNPVYGAVAIAVSVLTFFPGIRRVLKKLTPELKLMDALGLGIFVVLGTEAGFSAYSNYYLAVFVGVLTGVGGGVLRDLFAGDRPMIFVRNFYASSAILGSVLYLLMRKNNMNLAMICGFLLIVTLRILAVYFDWNLPKARPIEEE